MIKPYLSPVMQVLAATLGLAGCGPEIVRCDKADEGICREFAETSPDDLRKLTWVCDRESVGEGRCPRENLLGVCDNKSIGKTVHYYYKRSRNAAAEAADECQRMGGFWRETPPRD